MQVRHPCMAGGFQRASPAPEEEAVVASTHSFPTIAGCWVRGSQCCREGLRIYPGISKILGLGLDSERRRDGVPASFYTEPASPWHTRRSLQQWVVQVREIRPPHPRGSPVSRPEAHNWWPSSWDPATCGYSLYYSDGAAEQFISINKASRWTWGGKNTTDLLPHTTYTKSTCSEGIKQR